MQWILNLSLLHVVKFAFLLILIIQVLSMLYCLALIRRHGLVGDIVKFFRRYWRNDHITNNIGKVTLWVSSLSTYTYVAYIAGRLEQTTLQGTWERHPVILCYVIPALAGLIIYGIRKSLSRIALTRKTLAEWGGKIKKAKWVLKQAERVPKFIRQSRPATLAKGLIMKKVDRVVGKFAGEKFQDTVSAFCLTGAVEFAFRLSVIVLSIYAATGALPLW